MRRQLNKSNSCCFGLSVYRHFDYERSAFTNLTFELFVQMKQTKNVLFNYVLSSAARDWAPILYLLNPNISAI